MGERKVKAHCAWCGHVTNHVAVREQDGAFTVDHVGPAKHYTTKHSILQCLGCDKYDFMAEMWAGEGNRRVDVYPKPDKHPENLSLVLQAPEDVGNIYRECVLAFNVDAPTLTAVGLRAIVEAICIHQKCSGRNLIEMIDDLVTKGSIAKAQAEFLDLHRMLGNDAVHKMQAPSSDELKMAFTIVETVMKNIYELPALAEGIKEAREKRQGTP